MKRSLNAQTVSRHTCAPMVSVCDTVQNAAQKLYALRFYFFVFFFTRSPICRNCS